MLIEPFPLTAASFQASPRTIYRIILVDRIYILCYYYYISRSCAFPKGTLPPLSGAQAHVVYVWKLVS